MNPKCLMCDVMMIGAGPLCEKCILELQEKQEARWVRKTKCTFNLNADLHKLLKVAAAVREKDMVELVEEALAWFLHGNLDALNPANASPTSQEPAPEVTKECPGYVPSNRIDEIPCKFCGLQQHDPIHDTEEIE